MAQSDRVRYVSTFRAPTEYERQLEEARRRAALAEALAQQEYQPMEGTAAPIPKAAPLVKALQGYLTAREGRKAREAAEEAKGLEADYAQRMLGRMQGGYEYRPDAGLEQQMAKRPEETLDQYNQRIAATPFTAPAATVPEQIKVDEVTRQSQYRRAPEEVLGMASTSLGTAALKDRPVMSARLAEMLKTPAAEEFGTTPVKGKGGKFYLASKSGKLIETDVEAPDETSAPTELSRLIKERDALPVDSPLRATYDSAIRKQTTTTPPFNIDLGAKGDVEAQKVFIQDLGNMRPRAQAAANIIRSVNNLDRLTAKGTYVGSLAPTAIGASQFLSGLGLKIAPDVLSNTEQFQAAVSDLVLSTQASLGGARGFTKEETAILERMFPQIVNSPQARIAIGNIIRNKQLDVIDEYDSLIDDYKSTYKDSRIPYKKIDDEEVRYQRWRRSQGGG